MDDSNNDSIEKVQAYLKSLQCSPEVMEEFRKEKMDEAAVWLSREEQLKRLGMKDGDMIKLKLFCKPNNESEPERRERLKQFLKTDHVSRLGHPSSKKVKTNLKTIYAGLKHYDKIKKAYVKVYCNKGGGSLKLKLSLSLNKEDLIKTLIENYWKGSINEQHFGQKENLVFLLADEEGNEIHDDKHFTLNTFAEKCKKTRVKLYLLSKPKSNSQLLREYADLRENSDSEEDFISIRPPSHSTKVFTSTIVNTEEHPPSVDRPPSVPPIDDSPPAVTTPSSMIVISDNESVDFAENEQEINRLTNLMMERRRRLRDEPSLFDPHVTVRVIDKLGSKTRLFWDGDTFVQVYDWIGGLSPKPEFFVLTDYRRLEVCPSDKVSSGVYHVEERPSPPLMSPQGTIAFQGYASLEPSTSTDLLLENVTSSKSIVAENVGSLEYFRETQQKKLQSGEISVEVDREKIYENLIDIYKKRGVSGKIVKISFKEELAVGDGTSRDAFSAFFEKLYEKMDGFTEKVPSLSISKDDCVALGHIIHHAFVLCNIFPVRLAKAAVKYNLFGTVSKEDVVSSFLNFMSQNEADVVERLKNGSEVDKQQLLDIFSEYSVFKLPRKENVVDICEECGNIALIRNPFFSLQNITKSLPNAWKNMDPILIDTIYMAMTPRSESVIENMVFNETAPKDGKVSTWICRYIRSLDKQDLSRFLRFVTGSSTFMPGSKIKVEFVEQIDTILRPIVQTCFKILIVPRNFTSFSHLRQILNVYLNDQNSWSLQD